MPTAGFARIFYRPIECQPQARSVPTQRKICVSSVCRRLCDGRKSGVFTDEVPRASKFRASSLRAALVLSADTVGLSQSGCIGAERTHAESAPTSYAQRVSFAIAPIRLIILSDSPQTKFFHSLLRFFHQTKPFQSRLRHGSATAAPNLDPAER
jgi:hypothetical protein